MVQAAESGTLSGTAVRWVLTAGARAPKVVCTLPVPLLAASIKDSWRHEAPLLAFVALQPLVLPICTQQSGMDILS